MLSKRHIFSFATIVVGASATGIFRQFSSNNGGVANKSSSVDDSNPCHVTCSREYSPVCATDAETYENVCLFGIAKCINKDLQLVANVTCPDFLTHLSQMTHKRVLEGPNSLDSAYGAIGNLTKGKPDFISSALSSIPIIKIPSLNLPLFGISSNPTQLLKFQTSTTTNATTSEAQDIDNSDSSTYSTQVAESEDEAASTELVSDSVSSLPATEPVESLNKDESSSDLETENSTGKSSIVSSKSSLFGNKGKHISGKSRKMIEVRSQNKEEEGVLSSIAKSLQGRLNIGNQENNDGLSGKNNNNSGGILGNSGLILSNLDDTKATVQGMIKTIPYVPGRVNNNSTNVSIIEELSSIIKLPNGTFEGKGLLGNITDNEALSNIIERREVKNITANLNDIPYIKNITSAIMETSVLSDSESKESEPLSNAIPHGGRLNATEVVKNLSSSLSNISRNAADQNENQTQVLSRD
ncbi:hypothetical protein FG386_000174 [Cryptosporidium ryanae]|uniref:uncharacterized protein n=1 Tax=Cryptosporidium ryanae TaxID=515981 RepID=UPI00351A10BA|nr:hypothetical protein FG386_000174 [Cryptosporidium ryanae]